MGTKKRLEHEDGRGVELRLDTKRMYRFFEKRDGEAEVEDEDCKGDAPYCESVFLDRVQALLDEGYVVVDNPKPELPNLSTVERYTDYVVRAQTLAYTDLSSAASRKQLKEEFGFKTLKDMNAELDAWGDYLYGDPKLSAYVEERHLAACE